MSTQIKFEIDQHAVRKLQASIDEYTRFSAKNNEEVAAKYSKELAMNLYKQTSIHHHPVEFFLNLPIALKYKIKRFANGKPLTGGIDYKWKKQRVAKIIKGRIAKRKAGSAGWLSAWKLLKKGLQPGKMATGIVSVERYSPNMDFGVVKVTLRNTLDSALIIERKFQVVNTAILLTIANADEYIRRKAEEAAAKIFK